MFRIIGLDVVVVVDRGVVYDLALRSAVRAIGLKVDDSIVY